MLKLITGGFTLAAILAGLWAAQLWWRSSRISVPWRTSPWPLGHAPGDPVAEQIGEAYATMQNLLDVAQATQEAAWISGQAAKWTAVSGTAQIVATILGWIASG